MQSGSRHAIRLACRAAIRGGLVNGPSGGRCDLVTATNRRGPFGRVVLADAANCGVSGGMDVKRGSGGRPTRLYGHCGRH